MRYVEVDGAVKLESTTGDEWPDVQSIPTSATDEVVALVASIVQLGMVRNIDSRHALGTLLLKSPRQPVGVFTYMDSNELRQLAASAIELADMLDKEGSSIQ
jgi:hypothetical protein